MGLADDFAFALLLALIPLAVIWGGLYGFGWAAFRSQSGGGTGLMFAFRIATYLAQIAYAGWAAALSDTKQPSAVAIGGAVVGFCVVWWIRRHWSERPKVVEI